MVFLTAFQKRYLYVNYFEVLILVIFFADILRLTTGGRAAEGKNPLGLGEARSPKSQLEELPSGGGSQLSRDPLSPGSLDARRYEPLPENTLSRGVGRAHEEKKRSQKNQVQPTF